MSSKTLNPKNFSLLPIYKDNGSIPANGLIQDMPNFCKRKFNEKCVAHYKNVRPGFSQCPYGFSTYTFKSHGRTISWSGLKIKGYCAKDLVTERKSAEKQKFYDPAEIVELSERNTKLVEDLDKSFDIKIQSEKKNIDEVQKHTANAFHEIRPLNAEIKASTERLRGCLGNFKQELSDKYPFVLGQLDGLFTSTALITSRMELRDILINPSATTLGSTKRINLKKEIKSIYQLFRTHLRRELINIKISLTDNDQIKSYDTFKLVLYVVIENAIKYSPAKTDQDICVDFKKDSNRASLIVSSLGPQIQAEEKIKIFEAFYRGIKTGKVEGNGIGLFAARQICNQLEMTISVNQKTVSSFTFDHVDYFETTFEITFPLTSYRENTRDL